MSPPHSLDWLALGTWDRSGVRRHEVRCMPQTKNHTQCVPAHVDLAARPVLSGSSGPSATASFLIVLLLLLLLVLQERNGIFRQIWQEIAAVSVDSTSLLLQPASFATQQQCRITGFMQQQQQLHV